MHHKFVELPVSPPGTYIVFPLLLLQYSEVTVEKVYPCQQKSCLERFPENKIFDCVNSAQTRPDHGKKYMGA